jgi:hypothetical protein
MSGKRYNKGKNRIELLSPLAMWHLATVFTKGAEKYDDHNWALGMSYSSVFGCLERHTLKRKAGLLTDPETGCLHSSLIMSNAMILTHFDALPERYKEFDDLPNYADGIRSAESRRNYLISLERAILTGVVSPQSWTLLRPGYDSPVPTATRTTRTRAPHHVAVAGSGPGGGAETGEVP